MEELPIALVTGDIVRDAHLYGGVKTSPGSSQEPGTTKSVQPGGAALTKRLLATTGDYFGLRYDKIKFEWEETNANREANQKPPISQPDDLYEDRPKRRYLSLLGIEMGQSEEDRTRFIDDLPPALHSFGVWTPHPPGPGSNDPDPVWRVASNFGYGPGSAANAEFKCSMTPCPESRPAVILVDDGGIAFRHKKCEATWSVFDLAKENGSRIVIKMAAPLCRGDLLPRLRENRLCDQLVIIVRAEDLRAENALIRRRLSWEQTVSDTLAALERTPFKEGLLSAGSLVVSFGSAAALWIENSGKRHLVYDPGRLEGDFQRRYQGSVYGFQTCMASSITHHLLCDTDEKGKVVPFESLMKRGLMGGLASKQRLIQIGHGKVGDRNPGFPVCEVAGCISDPPGGFVHAEIPDQTKIAGKSGWTILEKTERPDESEKPTPLLGLALLTARYGLDALSDIPSFTAGNLFSVDRREIESLRTIESLIQTYEAEKVQEKPLSIGVFGPPGAGKSFAVKALSRAILGEKVPFLEFNLSQFKDPNELIGALHRVRDEVLKGSTPVAFWDEFDSQKYKWLQYLLAPMQDGAFQEGQVTHPIGKCIFVFAGGTSPSFAHFESRKPTPLSDDDYLKLGEAARVLHDRKVEFQLMKGPDFASRLHGHLDVLGPNTSQPSSPDFVDLTWPIRRALMLRGILKLKPKAELDIDEGLLRALLSVENYTHGSRSFEKIILALKNHSNQGRLVPSSLPPVSLLQQETDPEKFQHILDEYESFVEHAFIEKLAAEIHENYGRKAKEKGWQISPENDKAYADLSEDKKMANRAAARRIPEQLSLIDYCIEASVDPPDDSWVKALGSRIENHLERLAKTEHLGWNAERRANGWVHGKKRNDGRKIHPSIVSWAQLPETDREKDRENVKLIPELLQNAGFRAVPCQGNARPDHGSC